MPITMLNVKEHTGKIKTEGGVIANSVSLRDRIQKRIIIG
jgi:hypothetical protein